MTSAMALDLVFPSVVAVVGCGGKTTLIEKLAFGCRDKKVLISPTAKMYPPDAAHAHILGTLNAKTGKLEAAPASELANAVAKYDLSLLEADGSAGLPLKGYMESEPVVPAYCTHTVGILTLGALGKRVSSASVHRLAAFEALTGLKEGDVIGSEALMAMALSSSGMFKNSAGRRYLLINQIEDTASEGEALRFLREIRRRAPHRFARLLWGSARNDLWKAAE